MSPAKRAGNGGDRAAEITRLRLATLRLARRLRQHASHGITHSQLSALATIDRNGPLTLGELAQMEKVQPPSISRIVAALEGDGYVDRVPGPTDKRVALVQVTPKAARELEAIRAERDAWLAARMATLSGADQQRIVDALPALEALLESPDTSGAPLA
ncbi:MAG: MarR family transcriptional regulator [Actinobacteria bacterium]|nr:MarR family transcriptional regulator [Actinomycetota bacterium]